MALHALSPVRSSRYEESDHDLAELLGSAGRKRRILAEVLAEGRQSLRVALWVAAICAGLAIGVGALNQLGLARTAVVSAAMVGLGLMGALASAFALLRGNTAENDQAIADLHRLDDVIRHLKALRRADMTAAGESAALALMALDLAEIGARLPASERPTGEPGRRHERMSARNRPISLSFPDGTKRTATIRDISRSGVAINTDATIKIGAVLTLGQTQVRAVRVLPDGMAFEFLKPFPRDRFSPDMPL